MKINKIYDIVKAKFSNTKTNQIRFKHMEGVSDIALLLNEHHHLGLDENKVRLAGLLHDYAKDIEIAELKETIKQLYTGSILQDILEIPATYHAFACAYYIKRDLNISDFDILTAVTFHTTGKIDMEPLTKLIYISDFVEEGRRHPGSFYARKLAFDSLDLALVHILDSNIMHVQKNNRKLFRETEEIYQYYQERMNIKN